MATDKRLNLPRGIRIDSKQGDDRPKPHFVEWRIDGKRKTKWFEHIKDRDAFAKHLAGDVREHGVAAFRMDQNEVRTFRAFRAQLGEGVELEQVLECWRKHGVARPKLTVAEAAARYLKLKMTEGLDPGTLGHYRSIYDRLTRDLGKTNVHTMTLDELSTWMDGLEFEPETKRTVAARLRGLFRWLKVTRTIGEDPCDGWKLPKVPKKPILTLTVEETRRLFTPSGLFPREVYGRLALEAFSGIRFDTVKQMPASDIKFDRRGVEIPGTNIKTEEREYLDGLPENLWAWLEWAEPKTWCLTPRQYLTAKTRAFTAAGVVNPGNGLRKSFTTYHVAKNRDAAATSVILCHSSPKRLYRSYRGKATEADGHLYFQILPPKEGLTIITAQ